MKAHLKHILFFSCILLSLNTEAQDVPLFSQKLTNAFIYNPSFAGLRFGSATFSHRGRNKVAGDANTNFLSIHAPVVRHKFGVGFNLYQEDINVLSNLFLSGAFAYHIKLGDDGYNSLSFGASAEYGYTSLNVDQVNAIGDPNNPNSITQGTIDNDPVLVNLFDNNNGNLDFAFGANFQTRFIKIGGSLNRLATAFNGNDISDGTTDVNLITNYYTGYAQLMLPVMDDRDLFEPILTVRQLSNTSDPQYDFGAYYTYDDKAILGASYRTGAGSFPTVSAAFKFNKQLLVGYSHSFASISDFGSLGSTSEFTIRFDFFEQNYQTKFSKYRAQTKSAMAYRRKTLTRQITRKPKSLKQPSKNYHKKFKRGRDLSPSRRFKRPPQKRRKVKSRRRGGFRQRW